MLSTRKVWKRQMRSFLVYTVLRFWIDHSNLFSQRLIFGDFVHGFGNVFQIARIKSSHTNTSIRGEENGILVRQSITLCRVETSKGKHSC